MDTLTTVNNFKRLKAASMTAQQVMLGFGKAVKLMHINIPSATDWRKYTIRKYR